MQFEVGREDFEGGRKEMMLFKISMICVWALCVCFMLHRHSERISELERKTADHDSKLYNEVVRGTKNTKMLKATSAAVDAIAEDLKNTRNRVAEIEKQNGYKSRKKAHRNV